MSASLNEVRIIGNLGRDPETKYMPSGDAVTNISVATTRSWKNKDGEKVEETEWHRIVLFGRRAEVAGEYLKKGSPVYIGGYLKTRKWTDKEGKERYSTEIVAEDLKLLGSKPEQSERSRTPPAQSGGTAKGGEKKPAGKFDDMDDDIPF